MWGYVVSPLRCFKFSLGSLSWTELHTPPTHTHTQLQLGEQVTFATCLEQYYYLYSIWHIEIGTRTTVLITL